MKAVISRDEWLKALDDAREPLPEADANVLTCAELGELLGLGSTATKVRVRQLLKTGKATLTVKWIVDACGRRQRVPAYRLKEGKK